MGVPQFHVLHDRHVPVQISASFSIHMYVLCQAVENDVMLQVRQMCIHYAPPRGSAGHGGHGAGFSCQSHAAHMLPHIRFYIATLY